jgi:hypothetical protein
MGDPDQAPGRRAAALAWIRQSVLRRGLTTAEEAESYLGERDIAPLLKPASLEGNERYQRHRARTKQRMLDTYLAEGKPTGTGERER